jgi:hypothetical protein
MDISSLDPSGRAFNPMAPRKKAPFDWVNAGGIAVPGISPDDRLTSAVARMKLDANVWPFPTAPQSAVHWMAQKMAERAEETIEQYIVRKLGEAFAAAAVKQLDDLIQGYGGTA